MRDFFNLPYHFSVDFSRNLKVIIGISIGLFLFMIFFHPFKIQIEDFDDRIYLMLGFALITLLSFTIILILLPLFFPAIFRDGRWKVKDEIFLMTGLFVVHSGLYVSYAKLIGLMEVNVFLMFRASLITAILVIIMIVQDRFTQLKLKLERTIGIKDSRNELFVVPPVDELFTFPSALQSEQLTIRISALAVIKSASNYVEVFWHDEGKIKKKLIRSTLSQTEKALKSVPFVVRCHRTCLVNMNRVVNMKEAFQGLKLTLRDFPESVPVSRQYAFRFKDKLTFPAT